MEADGTGQSVASLAFIQLDGGLTTQLRIFEPVEHQ
jgi:hypothetical protein